MFGEMLGSLVSGGLSLLGASQQQKAAKENLLQSQMFNMQQQNSAQSFNAQQAEQARTFNAAEAVKGRDFSAEQAGIMRDYNAIEAEKSRQFSERMSSTAYQRATQDMRAAGINPMLAYMKGGADTGGSAAASSGAASGPSASGPAASSSALGSPGVAPAINLLEAAGSSARAGLRMLPEIKLIQEQGKTEAERKHTQAAQTGVVKNQQVIAAHNIRRAAAEAQTAEQELEVARNEAKKASIDRGVYETDAGAMLRGAGTIGVEGGRATSVLGTLSTSARNLRELLPRRMRRETTVTDTKGHGTSTFEQRWMH